MGKSRRHRLIEFFHCDTLSDDNNISNTGDRPNMEDCHILEKLFDSGCVQLLKLSIGERSQVHDELLDFNSNRRESSAFRQNLQWRVR